MITVAVAALAIQASPAAAAENSADACAALRKLVAADVVKPVRPAGVNGQPWWNGAAKFFMYPPSFGFAKVEGAAKYRYRILDDGFNEHEFAAASPNETLEIVWAKLPTGWVKLTVDALAADGTFVKSAGERKFWKSAAFSPGAYPKAPWSWTESSERFFEWFWNMKNTRLIAATGRGDEGYTLNSYPSKMYAAVIEALIAYSKQSTAHARDAMAAAIRGGDYLISVSQPKGAPLEYFSPTYSGSAHTAGKYAGQQMLQYPAYAASAYLKLYRETKEQRFLEAAKRTAATYLRLQGPDGTWPLKASEKDGREICPNRMFPLEVMALMEELYAVTGDRRYRKCGDLAFAFIEKGPLTDWNWEGQFEDGEPSKPYQNLTKHPACSLAIYLLNRFPGDRRRLAQARELLRWSEDQFVCWEMPARPDLKSSPLEVENPEFGVRHWSIYPGVLEQYTWYVLIDASAAKLIRTYLALYRAERNPLDLAKARALGDAIVRSQEMMGTGCIPTKWIDWDVKPDSEPWVNCAIHSAMALRELSAY